MVCGKLSCFFMICMYKHCYLPLLFVFVMKCFVPKALLFASQPLLSITFYTYVCACFTCSSVHVSAHQSPIACLSPSVLRWCLWWMSNNCFMYFVFRKWLRNCPVLRGWNQAFIFILTLKWHQAGSGSVRDRFQVSSLPCQWLWVHLPTGCLAFS